MSLSFDERFIRSFITQSQLDAIAPEVIRADEMLTNHTGAGSDFHGWLELPYNYDREEFARIKAAAKRIINDCDIFVVIGIGGSYLGARAAIEFIQSQNRNLTCTSKGLPQIFFAGNNISGTALNEILEMCEEKDVCVNVISKSGTTTEPAVAFRAFKSLLERKYGTEGAKSRIFATTDRARGTLKTLADQNGYETFVIPDDVGGRYSVLTACGLLPIAVAGIDIDAMMRGAADAASHFTSLDLSRNLCYRYAAMRNILHRGGKTTEVLVGFEPEFAMMGEWFKQLYGESEGKEGKGIWPCAAIFSTDLHSLGQFIQQGTPGIFETVVWVRNPKSDFIVRQTPDNSDGLNYLAGKKMSFINEMAMLGTMQAHNEGNVPGLIINLDTMEEYDLGYLFYFFEKACAISGYLLGINPFDQPGVEFYKKNMFKLLGKPNIK